MGSLAAGILRFIYFFQAIYLVTECPLAYPRPNWGLRVNGTRLPTRGGDEEVRVGPQGPNRLDA